MKEKPWFKSWVEKELNIDLCQLTTNARVTLSVCRALAAKYDHAGVLEFDDRAIAEKDIEKYTNLGVSKQRLAIIELVNRGYLGQRLDKAFEVIGFAAEQLSPEAERKKKSRDKSRSESRDESLQEVKRTRVTSSSANATESADPDWFLPIREHVAGLFEREVSSLSAADRVALGRYHAFRWCHCTKNERRNMSASRSITSGLANLGRDRNFGSLTVRQYVAAGDLAFENGGRTAMFSVWVITGVLEVSG